MLSPVDPPAIRAHELEHRYGERRALAGVSFEVGTGEIFAFVGPNGGGKTTLFRLLSTLIRPQQGELSIFGLPLPAQTNEVRRRLGVVFQAPSLDKKLTVRENLRHHAALYGLTGNAARSREAAMLERLALTDRAGDYVETLSGGLRRRVELAAGMLHEPNLLLLDEPSTGLDPGARADLWAYLNEVRSRDGVTIVYTTHLLEEAERADRLAILNRGELVALDTPSALRATVGGDSITIACPDPALLANAITERFERPAQVVGGQVRLELAAGHEWIARLVEAFPGQIESLTLGKPTLEDVFIARTGHRFWHAEATHAG